MTSQPENGSYVVLPVQRGGSLIVSSNPASLPGCSVEQVIAQYAELEAHALVSLTTHDELLALNLGALPTICKAAGLQWWHAPIKDMGEPDEGFEQWWNTHRGTLHGLFDDGHSVAVHCFSGYGRSGLFAARVLIERGMIPDEALAFVRQHRPGAVETVGQERYLADLATLR